MVNNSDEYKVEVIHCPACSNDQASLITHNLNIPYYNDYMMVNISCTKCGYRTSDFYNMNSKGYSKYIYNVTEISDYETKVVRSRDGFVSIPELEVIIEPFGDGTSWIRNIEGVLDDIKQKLVIMLRDFEDKETRQTVKTRLKLLKRLNRYEEEFHLIVEDDTGNSLIIPADESKLQILYNKDE